MLQARQKQIARLTREERLAALQIELSNKKTVRLGQLRKFARPVDSHACSLIPMAAFVGAVLAPCQHALC